MVTNFESGNKEYSKPQLIEVGDAIKATLGRYRRGHRDHRRYYYR
ncbi:hypothetical protein [Microseira wollei]|uniref:Uncharacterized protein n=1 Tax=Microseira wollei NIES-4236 TaxID=2530354 RepID=A0AAV3X9B4_9CYAN|nr:hypothetical protein [Microseira wollei]GET39008.1 hypothetical protein MiSe_37680 [Microseira wollei NIES-4236]